MDDAFYHADTTQEPLCGVLIIWVDKVHPSALQPWKTRSREDDEIVIFKIRRLPNGGYFIAVKKE